MSDSRPKLTTSWNQRLYGWGYYLVGLGAGLAIGVSTWWVLLLFPGFALCAWSDWRDGDLAGKR